MVCNRGLCFPVRLRRDRGHCADSTRHAHFDGDRCWHGSWGAAIDLNKRTASKTDRINWTSEKAALPQQIQDLQSKITSAPTGDPNLPLLQQQLLTAQQRLLTVSAQLGRIPATEVAASEGFIQDLLSDENGISFHRLQVFGWTLVFWAVFVSMLFKKVTMVDFDATQLALMGISGSTYLGFKLQEKQS